MKHPHIGASLHVSEFDRILYRTAPNFCDTIFHKFCDLTSDHNNFPHEYLKLRSAARVASVARMYVHMQGMYVHTQRVYLH